MKIAYSWLALFCLLTVSVRAEDDGHITYGGGDGASFKTAVIILGAKDEMEGTKAEYTYLASHFPHYKVSQQSLLTNENKAYDKLDFTAIDGSTHTLYFDINGFFGKL